MLLRAAAAKDAVTTTVLALEQMHGKNAAAVLIFFLADEVTVDTHDGILPVRLVFEVYIVFCLCLVDF